MNAKEYLNKYHPTAIRSMDEISKLVPGIDDFAGELIKMMEEYAKLTRPTLNLPTEGEINEIAKKVADELGGGLWGDYYRAAKAAIEELSTSKE